MVCPYMICLKNLEYTQAAYGIGSVNLQEEYAVRDQQSTASQSLFGILIEILIVGSSASR